MDDKPTNSKKTWAQQQSSLKSRWRHEVQGRPSSAEVDRLSEELHRQYFEVCKGEAKEDMETKDYLHQLTDIYVESSGTLSSYGHIEENFMHSMRRAVTLNARLAYDAGGHLGELRRATETTNQLTLRMAKHNWIMIVLSVVIALLAIIQAVPVVKSLFCK
ncbi:MAG: hypothetical protein Q8Q12_12625 [bacterium]|nr:hypothetical protein [bacterium]